MILRLSIDFEHPWIAALFSKVSSSQLCIDSGTTFHRFCVRLHASQAPVLRDLQHLVRPPIRLEEIPGHPAGRGGREEAEQAAQGRGVWKQGHWKSPGRLLLYFLYL